MAQLTDPRERQVFLAFDQYPNDAGQQAGRALAQRLQAGGVLNRPANRLTKIATKLASLSTPPK